jgi:cytidylate kinase
LNVAQSADSLAIDGPAASGKTTIGQMLAERLDYLFLDTGCMYRAVTLAALLADVSIQDEPAVVALSESMQLEIKPPNAKNDGRLYTVLLGGRDVTWELRSSAIDNNVSQVSAYVNVRLNLVERQRDIGGRGRVVMVGRDIGTVVLPDAPLKLYITASAEERANRRWHERMERDASSSYEQILADIVRRDGIDGSRRYSPMRPADDAIIIDTTGREPEQIIQEILSLEHFQNGTHQQQ